MEDDIDIKLNFGDIILARRMADNLGEHHEISPHIVIGREEDYYVVLQGTSQGKNGKYEYAHYLIEEGRHNITQDTYFKTREWKRIHKDKVLYKIDSLSKNEKKYLKKKISFSNLAQRHSEDWVEISMPPIEVGDIIRNYEYLQKYNYYLIVEMNDTSYKCISLERSNDENSVNINGFYYLINYDDVVEINDKENYIRPDTLKTDQVKIILTKYNRIQEGLPEPSIDRGSLIGFNGELYYVYNVEKDNLLMYKVSLDKDETEKEIKINDEIYYTNFKELSVSRKDKNIISIEKAKEKEIEENKRIKKSYSKENKLLKEKEKHLINKAIQAGTCVNPRDNNNRNYIVIYRLGNEICVIDYDDYLEGINFIEFCNVNRFNNPHKIQANEFSNVLEFVKDKVIRDFDSKTFLKVYKNYSNITESKVKHKVIEF